jgi:hypothetical protein
MPVLSTLEQQLLPDYGLPRQEGPRGWVGWTERSDRRGFVQMWDARSDARLSPDRVRCEASNAGCAAHEDDRTRDA